MFASADYDKKSAAYLLRTVREVCEKKERIASIIESADYDKKSSAHLLRTVREVVAKKERLSASVDYGQESTPHLIRVIHKIYARFEALHKDRTRMSGELCEIESVLHERGVL
jgi:Fic family protein